MNKTITPNDLLLFAYGDLKDAKLVKAISDLIKNDKEVYNDFLLLKESIQLIEHSYLSPPDKVIHNILSYSKALADINIAEPELRLMIQN